jgi:hypothetical protein
MTVSLQRTCHRQAPASVRVQTVDTFEPAGHAFGATGGTGPHSDSAQAPPGGSGGWAVTVVLSAHAQKKRRRRAATGVFMGLERASAVEVTR